VQLRRRWLRRADRPYGSLGPDDLIGCGGNDVLFGGAGEDLLGGLGGADRLYGGDGPESGRGRLFGGRGNDTIVGGRGRDSLRGMAGNDTLYSRDGYRDEARGGAGYDRARIDRGLDLRRSIECLF
jgi:Ca2+-binding RTX toxin-like protein